ncbi:DUF3883 domain-containing protein [Vibrio alginolyticus]|uniref:DUF3883 domain-containing protein n=1 Tax=Vibrio alginolyticus TaxID=663 RepID=UPI00111047FD|nr:DUF3883 domain-containing protein [Vibrio alginolyticus]TMX55709.1 hypothetical protein DA091_04665 [Vibrio alginolyticus]
MTPKQQLLEYRKTKYHIQESSGESMLGDDIKIDLHNSVQVLSEQLYSKDVHFVFELIQNAEDNHYAVGVEPKLHFELLDIDPTGTAGTKGCLAIYNNELGFELKNVKAVSSVGGSTKKNSKDSGYIGEKGIGFKSVFSVTPSPHIYSNGFQFSFRDSDEKTGLGYIIPYWEERVPEVVQKKLGTYNTCILLPLRDDPELDCLLKIRQELDNLDASLLLFLNKISELTVHLDGSTRRYSKEEHESYTSLINESEGNTKTTDYIVRKKTILVPEDLKESKRENVIKRELCLAFPKGLTNPFNPRFKVFSYLPTEVFSGLPFLINADFLLPASRESILVDKKWNHWICNQVAEFAADSICELVRTLPMSEAFCWIPLREHCNLEFLSPIFEHTSSTLRKLRFIPTTDGQIATPLEVTIAPPPLTELLEGMPCDDDYQELRFASQQAYNFEKQLSPLISKVENRPLALVVFLQAIEDELTQQPMSWFIQLYSWLSSINNPWACKSTFESSRIIPCKNNRLLSAEDKVFENSNTRIEYPDLSANGVKADFSLLNPELQKLLADEQIVRTFIKSFFGIMPMSQDEYLFKVALPFCEEHINEISKDSLWAVNQFVVQNWDSLKKDNLCLLSSKLPLKVESGEFVINVSDKQHVVTPLSYEGGTEWKTIYSSEEKQEFIVLSNDYIRLLREYPKRSVSDIFSVFKASSRPVKYHSINTSTWGIFEDKSFSESYRHYLLSRFRTMLSGPSYPNKTGCLIISPACLFAPQKFEDSEFRKVFYRWLTLALEKESGRVALVNHKSSWKAEPIKHFHSYQRQTQVDTELWFAMKSLAWLPTNNGLKRIGEVFAATDENIRNYGDALNFVSEEVPSELVKLLEIPVEVSADSILKTLRYWSECNQKMDIQKLSTIYRRLANQVDDLRELFERDALIYCPSGDKYWCTAKQAIWSSQSSVLGDQFHWLSDFYDEQIRLFWISSVGVADKPSPEHFARAWLALQDEEANGKQRDQLEVIYDRLLAYLRKLGGEEHPDWLQEFVEEARCFSYKNKKHGTHWVQPQNIYASDVHRSLRTELEREGVKFLWIPEGKTQSRYEPLCQLLGVQATSEVLETEAQFSGDLCEAPDNPLLTMATKRLLACLVKSTSDKDWLTSEQLQDVVRASEVLVGKKIDICYSLGRVTVRINSSTYAGDGAIYYTPQDSEELLKEDVASELSKMLFRRDFRRHEDTIIRLLGASDKRAESFMDRKGWNLTKKENDELRKMMQALKTEAPPEFELANDEVAEGSSSEIKGPALEEQPMSKETTAPTSEKLASNENPTKSTIPEQQQKPALEGKLEHKDKDKVETTNGDASKKYTSSESTTKKKRTTLSLPDEVKKKRATSDSSHPPKTGNRKESASSSDTIKGDSSGFRMLSYVSPNGHDGERLDNSCTSETKKYADRAERLICELLERSGFEATLLGGTNPGYDILAKRTDSDERIYVEVKSVLNNWNATGVGLSKTQFDLCLKEQDNYWLYVVEQMASDEPVVHRIVNPAEKIGAYYFDHNWRKLVEKEENEKAERSKGLEFYDMFDNDDPDAIFDNIMQSSDNGS